MIIWEQWWQANSHILTSQSVLVVTAPNCAVKQYDIIDIFIMTGARAIGEQTPPIMPKGLSIESFSVSGPAVLLHLF